MAIRHYAHTDTDAPVLSGQAGALANVLRKCLVDGYGSQAAAGWTVAFTDVDRVAFRQPLGQSNERYLYVDDTAAQSATIRAYDTMSDIDTGTDQFTGADVRYWQKSSAASSAARAWHLYTDDAGGSFYIFIHRGQVDDPPTSGCPFVYGFGDVVQYAFDNAVQRSWLATDDTANSSLGDSPLTSANVAVAITSTTFHLFPSLGVASGPDRAQLQAGPQAVNPAGNYVHGGEGDWGGLASDIIGERFIVFGANGATRAVLCGYLPGLHPAYLRVLPDQSGTDVVNPPGYGATTFRRQAVGARADNIPASTGIMYVDMTGPWGA